VILAIEEFLEMVGVVILKYGLLVYILSQGPCIFRSHAAPELNGRAAPG